jgi:hypothetical protein
MCGCSEVDIGDNTYELDLGYGGGKLYVNNDSILEYENTCSEEGNKLLHDKDTFNRLHSLSKEELVKLIMGFVENAEEG